MGWTANTEIGRDAPPSFETGIDRDPYGAAPSQCLIPLGLQHDDHREVRRVALLVAASTPALLEWIVYEDLPYGPNDRLYSHDQFGKEALASYSSAGFVLTEIELDLGSVDMKADAVEHYQSQLRGLRLDPDFDQKIVEERYWALSRQ